MVHTFLDMFQSRESTVIVAEREFCLVVLNQTGVRGSNSSNCRSKGSHPSISNSGTSAILMAFSADTCLHFFEDLPCQ